MRYITILLIYLLVGCGNANTPTRVLQGQPSATGTIETIGYQTGTTIITRANGARIEVASIGGIIVRSSTDPSQDIIVDITEQTTFFRKASDQYHLLRLADLTEGSSVLIFCDGAIAAAAPRSCVAAEIIITK